jgi:glucose-6-phosphate isomerase
MDLIRLDDRGAVGYVSPQKLYAMEERVEMAHRALHEFTGPGKDGLGWLDWPEHVDERELLRLAGTARRLRETSEALVVIGIGGSYLGAKAGAEMLLPSFWNELPDRVRRGPRIYWAGHHLDSRYLTELLERLDGQDVAVNVISKSGTTLEPALTFRFIQQYMEKRYGAEKAARRIVVTTDAERGLLRQMADEKGYERFTIPADIGGRYSVLTPVGLFPLAMLGIDPGGILAGARLARQWYGSSGYTRNDTWRYAAIRSLLYRQGFKVDAFVHYDPSLKSMGSWFQQLFGESEGKDGKGLFPVSLQFTTDLHSMGQYMQEGERHILETVLLVDEDRRPLIIPGVAGDPDHLNYLTGKAMAEVNQKAALGTYEAHTQGGVPCLEIRLPRTTPEYFGALTYFFMKSCALSGYLLGVNPFDQPGVEAYKVNMFRLLGKPER